MLHYAYSAREIADATASALATLAWSTADENGDHLDGSGADWDDDAHAHMLAAVDTFMSDDRVSRTFDLLAACGLPFSPAQIGHDYVLTVNGHGAGFWDRGHTARQTAILRALSDALAALPTIDAYRDGDALRIDA